MPSLGERIRRARPSEHARLTELALRSKASHGYPDAFVAACRVELVWSAADIEAGEVHALVDGDDAPTGFCALSRADDGSCELEALFVEPGLVGRGRGRRLMAHAIERAAALGATELVIQSDPHAAGFYRRIGARHVGMRESGSVAGRWLPVLSVGVRDPRRREAGAQGRARGSRHVVPEGGPGRGAVPERSPAPSPVPARPKRIERTRRNGPGGGNR